MRTTTQQELETVLKELGMITKTTAECVEHVKRFCTILDAAGIVVVEATYDGSGDSGDITVEFIHERDDTTPGNERGRRVHNRLSEYRAEELLISGTQPLTTKTAFEEFKQALFNLLPSGWEINDGAFGDIRVEVETRKITVEHHERYTDITTTRNTY